MNRLPLRTRVMVGFGLVTLAVTSVLAALTWVLASDYMTNQRERSAVRQATGNARYVADSLVRHGVRERGLRAMLDGLGGEIASAVLLDGDQWVGSGALSDRAVVPTGLLREAGDQPASQLRTIDGVSGLLVAVRLPAIDSAYFEFSPRRELERTLAFLRLTLVGGTVLATGAGALLGRWAATHALSPLRRLTAAAREAAAGDLSVRLPEYGDPDLTPLAQAFNDTASRLQRRVSLDARFAGDVSHELRSPLTTMLNAMSVLDRRRGELSPEARRAVDLLAADLRRFRRMIDDLLEISRHDQHEEKLTLELIDLAELVGHAAREHGHAQLVPAAPGPVVLADRRCLERIVANLIENADRHGDGLVRLGVLDTDGHARIEVDDAGAGVPVTDRSLVFERFTRGSNADGHGAGLGLALVAQHVRRHRGSTWVEDRPGGGARFVVNLPREPAGA